MIDSRAKGARGELKIRDTLRELTGLSWERTPGSGMFGAQHGLKGDLYIPGCTNTFTVEVKNYEDDHLTSKILTNKTALLPEWWKQTVRQADQNKNQPLLIFKFDRSKIFVAANYDFCKVFPTYNNITVKVDEYEFRVCLLEDFIKHEEPEFTK